MFGPKRFNLLLIIAVSCWLVTKPLAHVRSGFQNASTLAQAPAEDQEAVQKVIRRGLLLLKEGKHAQFLRELWPPDFLARATMKRTVDEVVTILLKGGEFEVLRQALEACVGRSAVLDKTGTLMIFKFDKPVKKLETIGFTRINDKWFIFQ